MATFAPILSGPFQGGTSAQNLALPQGATRALQPAAVGAIRCDRGSVWVTQAGNPVDVVLGAGERFVPARRGKVVVQALTDATLRLC